jgi:kumamolisin
LGSHAPVPIGGGGSGIGSGPLGGLAPNDIKYAYNLSSITPLYGTSAAAPAGALTGAGQNIGLFELDGYVASDVPAYTSYFSLPTVLTGAAAPVTNILLGGFSGAPLSVDGQTEVTLDIDMILALAPSPTGLYVYEADQNVDSAAPLTLFTRMANDLNPNGSKKPLLQVISVSWGITEDVETPDIIQGENTLFQQMAAQGQSIFCAAGDQGAYDSYGVTAIGLTSPSVDNPASQPYATGVGGTTLSFVKSGTTAAGAVTPGTYVGETVWSAGTSTGPEGGGGGVSDIWVKPSYQLGFGVSAIKREVPDVTLNADPNTGYAIFVNGTAEVIGGTSAAAPLWAGYTALINQQRTTNGLGPVGFMNPVLYPIAAGSSYAADFHDITTGSNLFYQAMTGYDDASGLGSFQGAPLLAALSVNANAGTGTATLSGVVTDSSLPPVPIAGATVSAIVATTGVSVATTTTDATGAYTLSVPTGLTLKISVSTGTVTSPTTENFSGTSVTLAALTAGGTATQNFVLSPAHTYAAGLQMISAPYDYTGVGDFAAVFGLTETQAQLSPRLIQYVPSLGSYVFFPTAPADTLRLGQGYWIRFPSPSYLHLTGTPASTAAAYSIPLQPGWNQIGDPFPLAVPLSSVSVVNSAGATLGLLGAAGTTTAVQPTLYGFNGTSYTALNPASDALAPYQGYWVFAFGKSSLSVPYPGAPPPPAPFASPQ